MEAYPHTEETIGIELRDYFAAKAIQGIYANPNIRHATDFDGNAKAAYDIADAMLRGRLTNQGERQ